MTDPLATTPDVGSIYRHLAQALRDEALVPLDAAGRVAEWPPSAAALFGVPADAVLGVPLGDALAGAVTGDAPDADVLARAAREGEWRGDVVAGGGRHLALVLTALHADGALLGYGLIARDVTAAHSSAHAQERRGELTLLQQRTATAANAASDPDDALQRCLHLICEVTGWPVGHAWLAEPGQGTLYSSQHWHLADPARFARLRAVTEAVPLEVAHSAVGRVLRERRPLWIEDVTRDPGFVRARQGDIGVRACVALPVLVGDDVVAVLEFFDERAAPADPQLVEVLEGVARQLGHLFDRAAAREALRHSEAKFAGIVALATDGIVSVDAEQRITLFNTGAEEIFGWTEAEVLGQPLDLLIPGRFRAAHHGKHIPGFAHGTAASRRMGERGEVYGLRKNGEEFPAEASISRQVVGGQPVYTAVVRDVTERRRAERALAEKAAELERSNAELAQFAYVASHDLQEPLRMVASYTQLLARRYRGKLDADADEFIGFAVDGVTRMQALINDLLALSRVGTRGRAFEPTALEAVLARTLDVLGPSLAEAGAEVTHDPLPTVRGDAGQLEQLLRNLLGNAVKFRGEAAPRVHVGATRRGADWELTVRDNGIGFDMQYADRIFQMFQRLHHRTEYAGTGIGLAICKKIVERHGGQIWVESAPGQGTTFHFTLPDRAAAPAGTEAS